MYEDTVKWESRYLCGPRLASELTGAAKAAISNKKRGWLSTTNGVAKLLNCLRETMSEPALPEIANQLRTYFRLFRRRKGEAMTAFCARHREEYARTCKALTRVMREQQTLQHQGRHAWRSGRVGGTGSRGPSTAGSSRGGQRDPGGDRLETAVNAEQDEESGEFHGRPLNGIPVRPGATETGTMTDGKHGTGQTMMTRKTSWRFSLSP